MDQLTQLIEAALFSADRPLAVDELRTLDPEASADEIRRVCDRLRTHFDEYGHAVELVEVADGYQLLTRREFADAITEARLVVRPRRLSPAALETLAIVAYRQPVSRAEIEEIRGVSVEGVLRSLQERNLVQVVGRAEGLGRPLLYGTSPHFLEFLGLKDVSELPRLDELSIALRPPQQVGPP